MSPRHPEHLQNFDYVGRYRYSLRFSTHARQLRFADSAAVELVLSHCAQQASDEQFAIVVYCFMPDHVHLLIEGLADSSDCKRFIGRAKQFSGFYFSQQFGTRLWQRYGYERTLRDDEATLVMARYILANPVRAGLVSRVEDYPFVGSLVYSLNELLEGVTTPGTTLEVASGRKDSIG